jgi:D-alanyl-D-alanine carboxypeptidase
MAGPPMTSAALSRKVHELAAALAAQEQFSGVVLLAQQGRPVLQEAFGVSDRDARTPMAVGTILNVSSVGKLFTQIAVGQLVAAGKLSLDSTIAVYWPDYPDATAARTVTIRHLLTHRSGIDGNIFAAPMMVRTNRDYVPLATKGPLAFAPGTQQRYSNAGYVVLGEIIQRVSGEVYHEYIQRHVFGPAGMSASGFPARDSLPRQAARGYTRGRHGRRFVHHSRRLLPWNRGEEVRPAVPTRMSVICCALCWRVGPAVWGYRHSSARISPPAGPQGAMR